MRRIDRERGHNRKNPLHEPGVEPGLVGLRQPVGAAQHDPGFAQTGSSKLAQDALLVGQAATRRRCLMSVNCCAAVRPSAEDKVAPAFACPISAATRTE